MSVVGRMASIFVNDGIINNKQTETISQKQKRPTSWGFSGLYFYFEFRFLHSDVIFVY